MSEVKEKQFELFFADKANVNMSSYKVDSKTNLSLLYLKDNKKTLWDKFEAIYPDGIKQTSFMARLANGKYVYRENLGGLCLTCQKYGYEIFSDLTEYINKHITLPFVQVLVLYIRFKCKAQNRKQLFIDIFLFIIETINSSL